MQITFTFSFFSIRVNSKFWPNFWKKKNKENFSSKERYISSVRPSKNPTIVANMSCVKFRSVKLLAKYNKVISNYKKISKIIAVDRLLDISGVPFKFSIFHVIDYSFLFHYFFSVIYILCTKFEDKMEVLRPLTLCPLAVQVFKQFNVTK